MTDFPEFFNSDDYYISDTTSPFYGLPTGDVPVEQDPNDAVLDEVLDRLGIDDFAGVFVDFSDADPANLRGNRFANLTDAIVYLAEAGILQFGDVTIDEEGEIGLEIEPDTDRIT